jgi:ATP-dependent Clp protease adaptor protein ClpS
MPKPGAPDVHPGLPAFVWSFEHSSLVIDSGIQIFAIRPVAGFLLQFSPSTGIFLRIMATAPTSTQAPQIEPAPDPKPKAPRQKHKPKPLPPFNVVLLDDDDHSYQYVIEMLGELFAHPPERAFKMAEEVDTTGRVIVLSTHKEKAELKRDQILAYGKDIHMARSKGSMSAFIEPAQG